MNLLAYDISKCHEAEEEGRACTSGKMPFHRGEPGLPAPPSVHTQCGSWLNVGLFHGTVMGCGRSLCAWWGEELCWWEQEQEAAGSGLPQRAAAALRGALSFSRALRLGVCRRLAATLHQGNYREV